MFEYDVLNLQAITFVCSNMQRKALLTSWMFVFKFEIGPLDKEHHVWVMNAMNADHLASLLFADAPF